MMIIIKVYKDLFLRILEVLKISLRLFFRNDTLMSKESIELLSNPETQQDFIDFSSGKSTKEPEIQNNKKNERSKKFTLKNGEEITVLTYS